MERSITMKYNTSISHGIEFNLGNGKYHSLSFSTLPDMVGLFLNKESLFLYLYEYVNFNNTKISFKRKNKDMLGYEHNKELFRKEKFLDESNNIFPFIKTRRHTQRENEGILLYVPRICGTESLDSTFYVDIPNHKRDIHHIDEVFASQYYKNLQRIGQAKCIVYNPRQIFKFDPVRIKDEYENKYPTIINEYLSMGRDKNNLFINYSNKRLNHKSPKISKNELIFIDREKTKLNKSLTDSFIDINVPQIFKMDNIKAYLKDKNLYYNNINYLLHNNAPNIFMDSFLSVKNGLGNNMYINNEWSLIGNNSSELHYIEAYVGFDIDRDSKKIITDDYIQAEINNQGLYYLDWLQTEIYNKTISTTYNDISLGSADFKIKYDGNIISSELVNKILNINNLSFLGDIESEEIEINNYFIGVNKYYHEIFKNYDFNLIKAYENFDLNKDTKSLFRKNKKLFKSPDQVKLSRDNYEIYSNSYISLWRQRDETTVNHTNKFVATSNKEVNVYDDMVKLDYSWERPIVISENININLYDKGINLYDVGILLNKDGSGVSTQYVFTLGKDNKAIRINDLYINLDMAPKGIEINKYYISADKYSKGIAEENGLFINKYSEGTSIFENTFIISKGAEPVFFIDNDIWVDKNGHSSFMDFDYTWISKNSHGSFMINDYTWISKNSHPSFMINDYTWISKNRHDSSMIYEYTWISKNRHDSSMVYDYPWISKNRHDSSMIYENQFIDKNIKDSYMDYYMLNVDRDPKGIYMDKNMDINKFSKGIRFDDSLEAVNKDGKGIRTEEGFVIGRDSTPIDTSNSGLIINHDSKGIRIEGIDFIDLDSKAIEEFKVLFANEYIRGIRIDKEVILEEEINGIWINNYRKYFDVKREAGNTSVEDDVRLNNAMMHGNLDYQGNHVSKRKKDTYLPEQYSFVEVINYNPQPVVKNSGKIDELILPHKDYTYNDFIKKLINDDGTINWTYVKNYDRETSEYTVSIPIENPMTIYADIGRDYLDVDVAILEVVIFLIRKVWKDNMYKYIALSAQDSLKHLMVEVDRLLTVYDLQDKQRKEAVRCMQLFRWYAEMAILNNCEYILKFDTTKICVDYYNKDLGDFKDIISFNNMDITDNYIIEPIDETKNCSITFKNNNINPGLPLNLSFRLYNINTTSSISIIETDDTKSTRVYESGVHDITVKLKNKVMVRYNPNDKYQSINIANININNKSIRGFTLRYKGKFGETNTVMQDLLDSMLVVGEASEELKQKLSDISPVTVAINTMVKYFKLHHENKLKGKRLITKK